ncbi:MAG: nitrophenyl compound nitroreductase subunit ArsF family protein [Candidatus Gorgyraea atricola]|nr:nitrophenyl compound nitroreductase subunit ArsF family protein [Candidatus Gorgyraea atricola]
MDFLKRVIPVFTIALFLFIASFSVMAAEEPDSSPGDHIIAYYFHSSFRCSNCHKIEKYTKESLDKYFVKEFDSGELVYKIINVDEKENSHFIEDYGLYTKSVVLSFIRDGKELEYKNLPKVWEYLDNKDKFYKYIKKEVNGFLSEL